LDTVSRISQKCHATRDRLEKSSHILLAQVVIDT
jgi:hypothetical protein